MKKSENINYELEKNAEVISQLNDFVTETVGTTLMDPDDCWQPTDFLPDMTQPDAIDQVKELRERAAVIPDTIITSLIGNMITEEALPSYQTYFNMLEGVNEDGSLISDQGWVQWTKAWTAEENRHGDLLNKYLYLSGRADMRKVEQTIHRLIYNGFDPRSEKDPYQAIVYTSFQERATKISHVNTGKLADKAGDYVLGKICKQIAGDEARHEKAYKSFMSEIIKIDPSGAVLAFEKMMRKQIVMPAVLMAKGGSNPSLFDQFSAITQKVGIYTGWDYARIIDHLVKLWEIETVTGLNEAASKAQEYLSGLSSRYMRLADRMKTPDEISLAWISK
ncbi:acyl-ACP desaturase [Cyclobacterium amurskyense]|jgi:acyl-[acyl-carrier-protein] desaturase|uniref:Putative acyl-ACP desaturase, Stearoyl-ACP desaturase n=1 Tax=Cyclobacterium amurskyense TaxID=320787 RepID=A0A0H4PBN2_9BACT|nr:acyl-ACP desaturase [Cyclobacterium amurskyense]AKP50520.1 Putative acyl-ACP desaturase, Stearoyl-ACP desaturase [Cyclobacterium amurskyense]|tara:strand:- start:5623 stop:6627 length:1005 start_codon:yes stop_codon:yes gene_type:complete